ncbi:AcrR family transcriptional regulator [Actinoplanes lutulentus]|uniref:TetR family transcriptional regulator n=1 Tax=Actinoplanes lutulentus TaxID=1287878 RepID=A0A327Z4U2_9ACTN|nr:TetR family transcriptional regulator [Actinoplanes lutulentus]MBB2948276.1 AcrR family transcriptional regulator [Actinoplanes lutulentus]RAK31227.1 TetR family transcriptional regulator [Actinoplanes lutulentus]
MVLRRDAQQNVTKLTAAAVTVFRQQGFQAPLEAVAQEAGVSIGTLYNRIGRDGTRETLIEAAAPVIAAERTDQLAAEARSRPDPWARFEHYVTALLDSQAASPPVDDIMARRLPESSQLTEQCEHALRHAGRFIAEAQADGSLRPDFRVEDLTVLFQASSGILRASAPPCADAWRRHLRFVLDGLRTPA